MGSEKWIRPSSPIWPKPMPPCTNAWPPPRATPPAEAKEEADLLVALAPHLDDFIGRLFAIGNEINGLAARQEALAPLHACKRLFVQRRAQKAMKPEEAEALDGDALEAEITALFGGAWDELEFARRVMAWLDDEADHAAALDLAARYAAWALLSSAGKRRHAGGHLFKAPAKHDPLQRVPHETVSVAGIAQFALPAEKLRHRDGFHLTDPRLRPRRRTGRG